MDIGARTSECFLFYTRSRRKTSHILLGKDNKDFLCQAFFPPSARVNITLPNQPYEMKKAIRMKERRKGFQTEIPRILSRLSLPQNNTQIKKERKVFLFYSPFGLNFSGSVFI